MSEDVMQVAREALDLARDVDRRVNGHEDICAIRYRQLEHNITEVKSDIGDVKKILAWAGTTGFGIIMAALAFFIKVQFDANSEMQKTIQELQTQSMYERTK